MKVEGNKIVKVNVIGSRVISNSKVKRYRVGENVGEVGVVLSELENSAWAGDWRFKEKG